MRKLLMVGAVFAALALPTASQAQFTLGARLGYGIPMGDEVKDLPLSDSVKSQIPIQIDALYRITPEISAGLYLSYGFVQLSSDVSDLCDALSLDCSASSLRIGAQATYTLSNVSPSFAPWFGAGIGWESMTFDSGVGSADETGFEFLNLQGGADFKVSPQLAVGPYAQFSIGQFSSIEGNDITDKGMHEWLSFGVRGKFDL